MVIGIGTDIVEISRFSAWASKSYKSLRRIFSHDEIIYALSDPDRSAERFAARFAAREALFKASSEIIGPVPFLSMCSSVSISQIPPRMTTAMLRGYRINVSWSHSRSHAIALVIIEKV